MGDWPMQSEWRSWSTADVEVDRRDYWVSVIEQGVVAANLEGTTRHFACTMASRSAGDSRFIHFKVSGEHRIRRDRGQTKKGDDRYYMLGLQTSGSLCIEQGGERLIAAPGDLVALHSGHPFELTFTEAIERRVVLVPRVVLDRFLPKRSALASGRPIAVSPCRAGFRAAADLVRHLTDTSQLWDDDDCATSIDCLAQMFGSALTQSRRRASEAASRHKVRGRDIVALIGRRASEFELSPAAIARQLDISIRSLHRLLAQEGLAFSTCLLDARLDQAFALLRQEDADRQTLTAIAMATGFCDAAHFSRTFCRKFGLPPSKARAAAR